MTFVARITGALVAFAVFSPAAAAHQDATNPATAEVSDGWLTGKLHYRKDPRFTRVPKKNLGRGSGRAYLHRDVLAAWERMAEAAQEDGVRLRIVSAVRTFRQQKWIWERKWRRYRRKGLSKPHTAKRIMRYSAVPGASRHHWGTEVDINSVRASYFGTRRGRKVYRWLRAHAAEYGFVQTYGRHGPYREEKWHWSWRPLAEQLEEAWLARENRRWVRGFRGHRTVRRRVHLERFVDLFYPESGPAMAAYRAAELRRDLPEDNEPELLAPDRTGGSGRRTRAASRRHRPAGRAPDPPD